MLHSNGSMPSLEIMRATKRSISGHNTDLSRLGELGYIISSNGVTDKRQKFYHLTEKGQEIIAFAEGRSSAA